MTTDADLPALPELATRTTVKDSLPVETVPWPTVTRYSGGASHEGVGGRVWIRLSDEGQEVEYVPATPAIAADRERAIDMVLYCPNCGMQHIDAPESDADYRAKHLAHGGFDDQWTNPPHRSHLCHGCGCTWRPADVPTNGVAEIQTEGKADSWPVNADEISAQPAQQTADARDAARYRWLRDNHETNEAAATVVFEVKGGQWDAAIDAARSKP